MTQQKKQQPQATPATPAKEQKQTPLVTELTDTDLDQVTGGLSSGIPDEGITLGPNHLQKMIR
ncbi:MAG TPA: hypothetical protein VH540_26445 [Ktedonobacterales bacterium]|jgi:bacteriocin-like protein